MSDEKELQLISTDIIKGKIYNIRGVQVMLDSDLARLYGVETRILNQAVKRNQNRFPSDFCFQLTINEYNNLKSQFVISSLNSEILWGGRRKLPIVFTEHGITALSSVLKSDIAADIGIKIVRAFVAMRHYLSENAFVFQRLDNLELKQIKTDERVEIIFNRLEQPKEVKAVMFFKGQMYDASTLIKELISSAKSDIILIDNYTDRKTLDCFVYKNKDIVVTIYTQKDNCKILESEITDFNLQYGGLTLNYIKDYHDRFLIIDKTKLYHIGASLKDAGKKAFAISEIEDEKILKSILKNIF